MKIINIIIILISTISSLCSEVICNLHFTDENKTGFKLQGNEWMIKEAQEAATLIGKLIKQDACINIRVNSTNETPYAWAPTEHFNIVNEKFGNKVILSAQRKILTNDKTNTSEFDGHVEFNTSRFCKEKSIEFRQAFIHELTHTLGFLNFQEPTSTQITYYNDFDKLLHDGNGNPFLINKGDPNGNYFINPKFNPSLEMYACGDCIRKQNNGNCVKIHNPKIIEQGSSFAHLDSSLHPRSIMTSRKCNNEYYIWNNYELGIMQELGYEIDWDNYCKIFKELYPSTVTINIDKKALADTNTHFEVLPNPDFPSKCCQQTIKDENTTLSVKINHECQLVLVDSRSKNHLLKIKPNADNSTNQVFINNKIYKVILSKNSSNKKTEIDIKFTI